MLGIRPAHPRHVPDNVPDIVPRDVPDNGPDAPASPARRRFKCVDMREGVAAGRTHERHPRVHDHRQADPEDSPALSAGSAR